MIIQVHARKEEDRSIYIYRNGYYQLYIEEFDNNIFFEICLQQKGNGSMWNTNESYAFELYVDDFYAYGEKPTTRAGVNKKINFKSINFKSVKLSSRYYEDIDTIEQIDCEIKGLQIAKNSIIEFTDFINCWTPI